MGVLKLKWQASYKSLLLLLLQMAAGGADVFLDPAVTFLNLVGVHSVPSVFNSTSTDVIVGRNNVAGQGECNWSPGGW